MRTLNISCNWKKLFFLEKILDIVTYVVNLFAVSFFIILKIHILQKNMKFLHEKILKVLNLYWFRNDWLEKNNLLNGYTNKLGVSE